MRFACGMVFSATVAVVAFSLTVSEGESDEPGDDSIGPAQRIKSELNENDAKGGAAGKEKAEQASPDDKNWGSLKMRFVYDGALPEKTNVYIPAVQADREFCSKNHPFDEWLVVDPMSKGIANVVVWLYLSSRQEPPPPHPDYAAAAKDRVRIDNVNCRYEPHVCLLRTSQQLIVGNQDAIGHNSKIDFFAAGNRSFNFTIPASRDSVSMSIPFAERLPVHIACTIHPWMSAYLVVKDHPYFAVSDKDGNLTIRNLPTGSWTFQAWQEKAGYLSKVDAAGSKGRWTTKGRFEVSIAAGDNDLGIIKVAAANFE